MAGFHPWERNVSILRWIFKAWLQLCESVANWPGHYILKSMQPTQVDKGAWMNVQVRSAIGHESPTLIYVWDFGADESIAKGSTVKWWWVCDVGKLINPALTCTVRIKKIIF